MIKVCVVIFQNIRYCPFLSFYKKLLSSMDEVNYDVIYYNRCKNLREVEDENHISIQWHGKGTTAASKIEKGFNFINYTRKVKKKLKSNNYDFIIVLTTMPAILLSSYLIHNYSGRFLVDIRDYTQERFKLYYRREQKLFEHASVKVLSSFGFKSFLPKSNFNICHNLDVKALEELKERKVYKKALNKNIIISYIGSISYERQCKRLIRLVRSDDRFEFYFYGNESNSHEISQYINKIECSRIRIMGAFKPVEKKDIYKKSDLIFNCYGNDRMLVKYAISNKHYDGALYQRPLLVSPETTMSKLAGKFAYSLDLEKLQNLDGLYTWYESFDEKEFERYTLLVVNDAIVENKQTEEIIKKTIIDYEKKRI